VRVGSRQRAYLRGARTDSFEIVSAPQRSTLGKVAGIVFRLRAEITVAATLLAVWLWLTDRMAPEWAGITLGVVAVVLAAVPHSRRYVVRRAVAVETRHRLRAALVQCRVLNYDGNPPLLLWSRPTQVGERVWLLLRAGHDLDDLDRVSGRIATSCHGWSARVSRARRVSSLVVVDVIRRDPLARPVPFASRLAEWLRRGTPNGGEPAVVIPLQRPTPATPSAPAAAGAGDPDWSDYV